MRRGKWAKVPLGSQRCSRRRISIKPKQKHPKQAHGGPPFGVAWAKGLKSPQSIFWTHQAGLVIFDIITFKGNARETKRVCLLSRFNTQGGWTFPTEKMGVNLQHLWVPGQNYVAWQLGRPFQLNQQLQSDEVSMVIWQDCFREEMRQFIMT